MSGTWVFGYGSLVSPASFSRTLGRDLAPGHDFHEAELRGYGRRWNYGTLRSYELPHPDTAAMTQWTIVALGLTRSDHETTNGVIGWVSDREIEALDLRERRYDRVDITEQIATVAEIGHRVVTYVPRAEPVADFERARARGTAAITSHYWNLVDAAFAALGPDRQAQYRATTPDPGIPILDVPPELLPAHHRPSATQQH